MTVRQADRRMDVMKRIRLYIGLVSIFAQLVLVPDVRAEQVYFIESPFGSLAKTRQMLAAADVRVMLPLGYKQRGSEGVFDERAGVLENRTYRKGRFAIEMAIIKAGGGGYEFALTSSNAPDDLDEAHNAFKALARKSKSSKGKGRKKKARRPAAPEPAADEGDLYARPYKKRKTRHVPTPNVRLRVVSNAARTV